MLRKELLQALEEEMKPHLSPPDLVARLAEIDVHLCDGIEGRIELGLSPEEAEHEAVAAFGSAQAVGREMAAKEPLIDRSFLLASLAIVAYGLVVGGGRSFPNWASFAIAGAAALAHCFFWWSSTKAKRPQWVVLAIILIPTCLGLAVHQAVADQAFVHANLAGGRERNRALRDLIAQKERSLSEGFATFIASGEPQSPSRVPTFDEGGTLQLFERPNRRAAVAGWQEAIHYGGLGLRLERERLAQSDARQEALAKTSILGFVVRAMGSVLAGAGWRIAAFYVVFHLYGWTISFVLRRRRNARPRAEA